jgi:hypothetical protein
MEVAVTKAAKELIMVLLTGAGVFYILWGIFATRSVPGLTTTISETDWKAIGIGSGILVLTVLMGFFVRGKSPNQTT